MSGAATLEHPRDFGALLKGPLGRLVARPWLDQVTIGFLASSWLPMSRVWAAAILADGDKGVFLDNVEARRGAVRPGGLLMGRLRATASAARALAAAEADWAEELFGTVQDADDRASARAAEVEATRWSLAHNLTMHRLWYAWIASRHGIEPCRWAIPDRERMLDELGFILREPEAAFPWRESGPVVASNSLRSSLGREFWLRVPATPGIGGLGRQPSTARVFVPEGFRDGPTVILLHGICMELEQWRLPLRDVELLVRAGIRVVMPEGPWHGRRRPAGLYGGEPVVATAPRGAIDYFRAHGPEVGRLVQWCRQDAAGPVGVMGISLGSFVVQLVSTMSRNWPADSRPDAAFLVATAERIDEIGMSGAFGRAFRLDRALAKAGWTTESLAEWGRASQGIGDPVMDRANIFALLGSEDEVTPYAGGRALVERWRVPPENVTIRRQGHFSVAAGMMVDDAPTRAFVTRLFAL